MVREASVHRLRICLTSPVPDDRFGWAKERDGAGQPFIALSAKRPAASGKPICSQTVTTQTGKGR